MIRTIKVLFLAGLTLLSCEEIIRVDDISGDRVVIIAPVEGAVVAGGQVNLNWEPIGFADRYQVQVAAPDFERAAQVLLDTVTVDTLRSGPHQIGLSLKEGDYEWRVRGANSAYSTGYTTAGFSVDTTGSKNTEAGSVPIGDRAPSASNTEKRK